MIVGCTKVDRAPAPGQGHRDRVDEERHVVDDGLDDGVRDSQPCSSTFGV